jgi:hypothetical protein
VLLAESEHAPSPRETGDPRIGLVLNLDELREELGRRFDTSRRLRSRGSRFPTEQPGTTVDGDVCRNTPSTRNDRATAGRKRRHPTSCEVSIETTTQSPVETVHDVAPM